MFGLLPFQLPDKWMSHLCPNLLAITRTHNILTTTPEPDWNQIKLVLERKAHDYSTDLVGVVNYNYNGTTVPWYHGIIMPWYDDFMATVQGTMVSCYHETVGLRDRGTAASRYYGTTVSWYHGNMVLGLHSAMVL